MGDAMRRATFLAAMVGGTLAIVGATTSSLDAAFITRTFAITATLSGDSAPPDPMISGRFTITYDPTVSVSEQTVGFTVNAIQPADFASVPAGFTIDHHDASGDNSLIIGGLFNGVHAMGGNTLDYQFVIGNTETMPYFAFAGLARPGYPGIAPSTGGTVVAPEPSLVAMAVVAAITRRRRSIAG